MNSPRKHLAKVLSGDSSVELEPAILSVAHAEGVDMLLEHRLRGSNPATDEIYAELSRRARGAVAQTMFRQAEIRRIGTALGQAGLSTLLLKGNALALWLYPEPHLRDCGDIDLCLRSREDVIQALGVLAELGYDMVGGPRSTNHEVSCRLLRDGRMVAEVDLHSRLVNSPLFADRFTFSELWGAGVPLPGNLSVRYLCPWHALLHAAMHRAVDLSNGSPDRLKWLYDFHLFAARLTTVEWRQAVALAGERGLAGVLLRSLEDTLGAFGTQFPQEALEGLARFARAEPLQRERLGDWGYVQRHSLRSIPGVAAKTRWLLHRLLPTRAQMESLYGRGHSWPTLVARRLGRGVFRLFGR